MGASKATPPNPPCFARTRNFSQDKERKGYDTGWLLNFFYFFEKKGRIAVKINPPDAKNAVKK